MDYKALLEKAEAKIQKLEIGEGFEVKALFNGIDWENLTRGEKILFGRYFSNEVNDGNVKGVRKIGKAKNNHTIYIKYE